MTTTSRSAELRTVWFLLGFAALVVALSTVTTDSVSIWLVGWFFGGPVAATMVAFHRAATVRWTAETGYIEPRLRVVASVAIVATGFAVSIAQAGRVALELS